ncbi:Uncharacterized protein DAT39_005764 [Clarias magur]|uniref:Uncharacterized protein n=1 Tax=Clarias magur TaxID=1594786 RepID=A0A8J4UQU3_CLAMG|nr:Uncharacterized protein DAT39_005764 [Clarias magur]
MACPMLPCFSCMLKELWLALQSLACSAEVWHSCRSCLGLQLEHTVAAPGSGPPANPPQEAEDTKPLLLPHPPSAQLLFLSLNVYKPGCALCTHSCPRSYDAIINNYSSLCVLSGRWHGCCGLSEQDVAVSKPGSATQEVVIS